METAKRFLEKLSTDEADTVSRLVVRPHQVNVGPSFYEDFALRGIRVERVEPDLIFCAFTVPPRLTDSNGNLANGAIANLIDIVGNALIYDPSRPMNVSVDMSITYISTAKLNDELGIVSRFLGKRGPISGTSVVITNKVTGRVVAEGRHSLFTRLRSKI